MRIISKSILPILLFNFVFSYSVFGQKRNGIVEKDYVAYLFAYFTGNKQSQEQIHFAVSMDGFIYKALNNNKPVLDSKIISSSGGMRDPHILRGIEGHTFYMVATDMVSSKGWDSNRAIVLLKSHNLINWSSTFSSNNLIDWKDEDMIQLSLLGERIYGCGRTKKGHDQY